MNRISVVEVWWGNRQVGRIALTHEGLCAFEYTAEWLANGISISPFELPLRPGVMLAKPHPFTGGFGVFDDCLPDGWGLLVLHRYLQKQGIVSNSLTILDRLSLVGASGRGALEFRPDRSVMNETDFIDFERLALVSEQMLDSKTYQGDGVEELYQKGGSPGGSRPKVTIKQDGKEWLVKFRAKEDSIQVGREEYGYSLLAKDCGIEMPETRLFEEKYFGVERFDRAPNGKLHVVSVAGLLCADYRLPCIDYLHIFQLCGSLTHNMQEMWKVYRLMVFNYLIGNKDDHAKNFSFIYRDNSWHFAPAFDLLPSDGINGYRTTSINDKIEPDKDDLFLLAERVRLDKTQAIAVFNEIKDKIQHNTINL